jgi:hypothetical protein
MPEPGAAADWAASQRRRWNGPRLCAALALHALLLAALTLAIDRLQMPRHGQERETTLVAVALRFAPLPPSPPVPVSRLPGARPPAPRKPDAPARPRAAEPPSAISLPAPSPPVAAAPPPASAPRDLKFLDSAATRQAIRAVARGDTLASRAKDSTREDAGSELVATDGSHDGTTRHLAPASPAAALSQGANAAHKADCMKDFSGMVLLAAPVILAAEAMGKCAHKL